MKYQIMNRLKSAYGAVRVANIRPTGVLATRILVLVMLIPIWLVITEYVMAFARGYVSSETNKLIDVGLNIIDHIFIPSVLTAVVGFLGLWLDRNNNGVPDKLEGGKLLACYLQTAGCEVKTLQNDDLGLVCAESNEWGADIFVSLHCNAFNTQARGTETLFKSFNGQRLANDIQSQIIRSINTVDRGVKERQDLWVLNGTDATAVLVEMAFIDNDEDLALLNNDLDTIVRAIARGITDFIGGE